MADRTQSEARRRVIATCALVAAFVAALPLGLAMSCGITALVFGGLAHPQTTNAQKLDAAGWKQKN